jgi:hypothetical protein
MLGTNDTELQPTFKPFGEPRLPSRITSSMLQRDAFRQLGGANIHISHTQSIKPKALPQHSFKLLGVDLYAKPTISLR